MLNHYCNVNKCVCEERETWKEREGERNEISTAQLECPYYGDSLTCMCTIIHM